MARIVVVDDDVDVLQSVKEVLVDAGFEVEPFLEGQAALNAIRQEPPDVVILDIMMPELSGIEICQRLRSDPFFARLPIIFLTAKGRPKDVAFGLDAGADDYLVKPFEVVELPARVRALLRRTPGGLLDPQSDFLCVGDIKVSTKHLTVKISDQAITLTPVEHRLLYSLMSHVGQPVPVEQLLQEVWEYPGGIGDPKLVRVHIGNLRNKIEPVPENPRYVLSVRGRGYMLVTS